MGSQVKANCKCGYSKKSSVGGGKLTYMTKQFFPCHCEDCHELVEVNLKAEKLLCPDCNSPRVTRYNNTRLIGEKGKVTVAKSFDLILTDGFYLCPHCYNMSLQFSAGILWD